MRDIINSYKQYIKMKKAIMVITKICNTLATAFAQLFIIIGVLFTFSEIVDRISTRKYLKEHESEGKIGKEVESKERKF